MPRLATKEPSLKERLTNHPVNVMHATSFAGKHKVPHSHYIVAVNDSISKFVDFDNAQDIGATIMEMVSQGMYISSPKEVFYGVGNNTPINVDCKYNGLEQFPLRTLTRKERSEVNKGFEIDITEKHKAVVKCLCIGKPYGM